MKREKKKLYTEIEKKWRSKISDGKKKGIRVIRFRVISMS